MFKKPQPIDDQRCMGIQGLLPFIDSVAVDRHLSDFAGQTAAIDGYFWLRARSSHLLHSCTHLTHHAARSTPLTSASPRSLSAQTRVPNAARWKWHAALRARAL